ncbi:uncharacterized protein LOC134831787 [Culicoides brevitarsis]|uniref:uncharacterized protein LOC134831787 n=1 Tax=Culicoides brevitarsis TaxID=469753 RepID=UPI00307B2888
MIKILYFFVILCVTSQLRANVLPEGHSVPKDVALTASEECGNGPPTHMSPERCCKFPELPTDEYYEHCIEDLELEPVAGSEEEEDDLLEDSCVVECAYNRTGLTELTKESLLAMLEKTTKDIPQWHERVPAIVDACLSELTPEIIKEVQKETIKWLKEIGAQTRRICDLRYLIVEDCFYMKLFQECPESRFKNTKKCNSLLGFVQRCDDWY